MAQVKVDRSLLEGMTKRERQAFVREMVRQERERQARQRRQRRIAGWSAAGAVVVLAVAGGITAGVVSANNAAAAEAEKEAQAAADAARGPANMLTDGLLLQSDGTTVTPVSTGALGGATPSKSASTAATTGVLDVQLYVDPTSADAATFWSAAGATIQSALTAGDLSLELHPIAQTGSADALAAVAAFGCFAALQPDAALAAWNAMMQVGIDGAATGATFTAGDVTGVLTTAAATDAVVDCVDADTYAQWADAASTRATTSIPYATDAAAATSGVTVVAAGEVYNGSLTDANALSSFFADALAAATAG
ncbi:hypothetical protein IF188_18805 [Microbacterium sp. NEAU-LLC]|uniref:Thioredoxin-like fold domain-containing protein n=1 Tax=Microbacterium helvum TaxID=2773713 RepID=A0ABR8NVI0_9MICO|nr:hypothetical protein [Microbacterium helvum]MBD3943747.1 hypothetical protein [Microbacterium helvum]